MILNEHTACALDLRPSQLALAMMGVQGRMPSEMDAENFGYGGDIDEIVFLRSWSGRPTSARAVRFAKFTERLRSIPRNR